MVFTRYNALNINRTQVIKSVSSGFVVKQKLSKLVVFSLIVLTFFMGYFIALKSEGTYVAFLVIGIVISIVLVAYLNTSEYSFTHDRIVV